MSATAPFTLSCLPQRRLSLALALCGWLTLAHAQDVAAPLEVKPGDTASQLAIAHLPQGVTLDQMLMALLQANPKAFIDGNVNLLKAGVALRLPTAGQAQQLPPEQARQAVIEQTRRFIRHATRMADTVATTGAREKAREMSGKVAPDESPTDRAQPEQDKLVLSKSSLAASSPEARIVTERQTQDSRSQLGLLQQNLKDLQALVKGGEARPAAPAASAVTPSAPAPRAGLLKKFSAISTATLAIGAAVLALLGLLLYALLRSRSEERSSEDDEDEFWMEPVATPSPAHTPSAAEARGLAQMASIDLNLDTEPPRSTPGLSR